MRKVFLIVAGAALFSFQACESGTSDKDKTITDSKINSETSVSSDTTQATNNKAGDNANVTNRLGQDIKDVTTNTEMSNDPVETGATDQNDK